jgi:hypothetical protein
MVIPEPIRKCVAHIYTDSTATGRREPVGTTFGVAVELEQAPGHSVCYFVTARHIVNGCRAGSGTLYVRLNTRDGDYKDVPVNPEDWTCHDTTDVAISPIAEDVRGFDFTPLVASEFLATDQFVRENRIREGDEVFFVGLFQGFPGKRSNQPILRFGRIALARREAVSIKSDPAPNADLVDVEAYLVETHSWGGSSGAPAFLYFHQERRQFARMDANQPILGLIHGHYNLDADVTFAGDILYGKAKTQINSGIAIVIPASAIAELLTSDDIVEHRRQARVSTQSASFQTATPAK